MGGGRGGGGVRKCHATDSWVMREPAAKWFTLPVHVSTLALKARSAASTPEDGAVVVRRRYATDHPAAVRISVRASSAIRPTVTSAWSSPTLAPTRKRCAACEAASMLWAAPRSSSTVRRKSRRVVLRCAPTREASTPKELLGEPSHHRSVTVMVAHASRTSARGCSCGGAAMPWTRPAVTWIVKLLSRSTNACASSPRASYPNVR